MNKSLIPREDIKDLPDTPCHPVGSHFLCGHLEMLKRLTEVFNLCGAIILVGYIMITHKILCFVSVTVKLLKEERCD